MAQLTPIPPDLLGEALEGLGAGLKDHPIARRALARIGATRTLVPLGVNLPAHRADAVALARSFGIPVLDEPPHAAFSWDGRVLRARSEASVILHEIAHWQLCPPERRGLADFGLGAGPETGLKSEADRIASTDFEIRQDEEAGASLLGILWEAALGQPAILAFLEQNWLEGWDRPAAAHQFARTIHRLHLGGFVDDSGAPRRHVNRAAVSAEEAMADG